MELLLDLKEILTTRTWQAPKSTQSKAWKNEDKKGRLNILLHIERLYPPPPIFVLALGVEQGVARTLGTPSLRGGSSPTLLTGRSCVVPVLLASRLCMPPTTPLQRPPTNYELFGAPLLPSAFGRLPPDKKNQASTPHLRPAPPFSRCRLPNRMGLCPR